MRGLGSAVVLSGLLAACSNPSPEPECRWRTVDYWFAGDSASAIVAARGEFSLSYYPPGAPSFNPRSRAQGADYVGDRVQIRFSGCSAAELPRDSLDAYRIALRGVPQESYRLSEE